VSQPPYSKVTIDGLVADVMFSFQRHWFGRYCASG